MLLECACAVGGLGASDTAETGVVTAGGSGGEVGAVHEDDSALFPDGEDLLSPTENEPGASAWAKKPSPMMPWDDIDKFEPQGAVITEADQYEGNSGNQATDTASSFENLPEWDNHRACAELARASQVIGRWSKHEGEKGGTKLMDSAGVKQALRRCRELEAKLDERVQSVRRDEL